MALGRESDLLDALLVNRADVGLGRSTGTPSTSRQPAENEVYEIRLWRSCFTRSHTWCDGARLPSPTCRRAPAWSAQVFSAHARHFFHMLNSLFSTSACCELAALRAASCLRASRFGMLMMWW